MKNAESKKEKPPIQSFFFPGRGVVEADSLEEAIKKVEEEVEDGDK